jgi:hypothetical protein
MIPLLVQLFSNEESTNIIPVPWMLASSRSVSWNRSSSSCALPSRRVKSGVQGSPDVDIPIVLDRLLLVLMDSRRKMDHGVYID